MPYKVWKAGKKLHYVVWSYDIVISNQLFWLQHTCMLSTHIRTCIYCRSRVYAFWSINSRVVRFRSVSLDSESEFWNLSVVEVKFEGTTRSRMRCDVMPKLDLDPGGSNGTLCFWIFNDTVSYSLTLRVKSWMGYMKDCDSKFHHARHLCEYPLHEARWV